ncbi:MAG: hypothetical protein RIR70_2232 [Pseudomonadota bacterium]|jgi:flagellin-like hook-associated protein FlgL
MGLRISTRMYYAVAQQSMVQTAEAAFGWQRKLASGQRIDRASEDPVAAGRAVILSARLSRIEMLKSNQDFAQNNLQDMDTALDAMQTQLGILKEVGVQSANSALDSVGFAALKARADAAVEELEKSALQKDSAERALFDNDVATELDVQAGMSVKILLSRNEVYGDGADLESSALMAAARAISNALEQGRSPNSDEVSALTDAQEVLIRARTKVGLEINATDGSRSAVEAYELGILQQKSALLDTDIAEGVSEFSRNMTLLETARSLFAKINSTGLFGLMR